MNLKERAYTVDSSGVQQLAIEDAPLLEWASKNNLAPHEAQLEALREKIVPSRYLKNLGSLDFCGQMSICSSTVFICGCGGLGGILINLLARAGVGRLHLADGDIFAPSNLNRQLLSDTHRLSRPKALVAKERVRAINPLIDVKAFAAQATKENIDDMMEGCDLALDALDNLSGRFLLSGAALCRGIPFIHAAVAGWWGQISTFLPGCQSDLKMIYGSRRAKDSAEDSVGVLGPVAALIGSLEALEALRVLSGMPPAYADKLLYFDGESGLTELMPLQSGVSSEE